MGLPQRERRGLAIARLARLEPGSDFQRYVELVVQVAETWLRAQRRRRSR